MKNKYTYRLYYIIILIILPLMSILTLSVIELTSLDTQLLDIGNDIAPEAISNEITPETMSNEITKTQRPELGIEKQKDEIGINYRLLIGILISTILIIGGIYVLYRYGYLDFLINATPSREVIIKSISQLTKEFQPVIGFDLTNKLPLTMEMSDENFKAMYDKLVNLMQIIQAVYLENVGLSRDSKTIVIIIESIIAGTHDFELPSNFSWNLFGEMVVKRQQLHLSGLLTVANLKASNDWFLTYLNLKFAE